MLFDLSNMEIHLEPLILTESENNLDLPSRALKIQSDGAYTIYGLKDSGQRDGVFIKLINDSNFTITLAHNITSDAENRIFRQNGANYPILPNGGMAELVYREVEGRTGWWLRG